MKKNKYNARKTECKAGHRHDSRKEAQRCDALNLMQRAGEIEGLEIQPRVELLAAGKYQQSGNERAVTYIADFRYRRCVDGMTVVEDVKGIRTREYIIKRKLFKHKFCRDGGVEFREL